jgi:hypothetical protein
MRETQSTSVKKSPKHPKRRKMRSDQIDFAIRDVIQVQILALIKEFAAKFELKTNKIQIVE